MAKLAPVIEQGLPRNNDAERFVLGLILIDDALMPDVTARLTPEDFHLSKHKLLFRRMLDIAARDERIDYVTLVNELMKRGELEAVDGIAYVSGLSDGVPRLHSIDAYVSIIEDKARKRDAVNACYQIVHECCEDADESQNILARAELAIRKLSERVTDAEPRTPAEVLAAIDGGAGAFLRGQERGLSLPWPSLDEMLYGWKPKSLYIVGGRPGMGKSAFIHQAVVHVAKPETPALLFTLEMTNEECLKRMVCQIAGIDSQVWDRGALDRAQRVEAARILNELKANTGLLLDDRGGLTVEQITAVSRKQSAREGLALVAVDHLSLVATAQRFSGKEEPLRLGHISWELKKLAKDLAVPVVALSQLKRPEDGKNVKPPTLTDLAWSGRIEQNADCVIGIHRPHYYRPSDHELRGMVQVNVAKQRGGPTGFIGADPANGTPIRWRAEHTTFWEFTERDEPEWQQEAF